MKINLPLLLVFVFLGVLIFAANYIFFFGLKAEDNERSIELVERDLDLPSQDARDQDLGGENSVNEPSIEEEEENENSNENDEDGNEEDIDSTEEFDNENSEENLQEEQEEELLGVEECFDGEDNDLDGKVDFEDFGCFGPNGQETNTNNGWTLFEPSEDSRIVYVSSDGDDSASGLSPENAKKTIAAGVSLIRDGYPDWLLLERGGEWNENLDWGTKSGRSENELALVGSYGNSLERPKLNVNSNEAGIKMTGAGSVKNVAFLGIYYYSYERDPNSQSFDSSKANAGHEGIRMVFDGAENVIFEDNRFEFFKDSVVQAFCSGCEPKDFENIVFRRNIFYGNYRLTPPGESYHEFRSQGIYVQGALNVVFEENLFDHNGWNAHADVNPGAESSIYDHNVYHQSGQGPLEFKKNIIARAASHGVQMRSGGIAENNLFLRNAISLLVKGDSDLAEDNIIRNNVVLDGKDILAGPTAGSRGWGITIEETPAGTETLIEKNIVAHKPNQNSEGDGFAFEIKENAENVIFSDNIDFNWDGVSLVGEFSSGGENYLEDEDSDIDFADPNRDITSYYNEILHPEDEDLEYFDALDRFLKEARESRAKFFWDGKYSAESVNDYIREGFEIVNLSPNEENSILSFFESLWG